MNQKKLEWLIRQKEGVTLEFKQEMYDVSAVGEKKKKPQEGVK